MPLLVMLTFIQCLIHVLSVRFVFIRFSGRRAVGQREAVITAERTRDRGRQQQTRESQGEKLKGEGRRKPNGHLVLIFC